MYHKRCDLLPDTVSVPGFCGSIVSSRRVYTSWFWFTSKQPRRNGSSQCKMGTPELWDWLVQKHIQIETNYTCAHTQNILHTVQYIVLTIMMILHCNWQYCTVLIQYFLWAVSLGVCCWKLSILEADLLLLKFSLLCQTKFLLSALKNYVARLRVWWWVTLKFAWRARPTGHLISFLLKYCPVPVHDRSL